MKAPVVAVCHGGGPMPLMADPGHKELIKTLSEQVPKILGLGSAKSPRAIVLVTAHWNTPTPTITSNEKPKLLYDYGGFPPETYELKYDAPGSPTVAQEVYDALKSAGFSPTLNDNRGWDHGVFVPMTLINPKADIPIVQLSVLTNESPSQHFAMGVALSSLRESNVAIVGSGMYSMHNLPLMFSGKLNDKGFQERNKKWSETLTSAIECEDMGERLAHLETWRKWEGAKEAHPDRGVEHFLPLIVCAGAGGVGKAGSFRNSVLGTYQSSYFWSGE